MKPLNVPQKHASVSENLLPSNLDNPDSLKSISHELRTPLNVIIGICQFLERDQNTPLSPMHRDAVDRMERNARALLQAVNRLLNSMRNGQTH